MTSTGNAKAPINIFPGLAVVDVELVVVSVPKKTALLQKVKTLSSQKGDMIRLEYFFAPVTYFVH